MWSRWRPSRRISGAIPGSGNPESSRCPVPPPSDMLRSLKKEAVINPGQFDPVQSSGAILAARTMLRECSRSATMRAANSSGVLALE